MSILHSFSQSPLLHHWNSSYGQGTQRKDHEFEGSEVVSRYVSENTESKPSNGASATDQAACTPAAPKSQINALPPHPTLSEWGKRRCEKWKKTKNKVIDHYFMHFAYFSLPSMHSAKHVRCGHSFSTLMQGLRRPGGFGSSTVQKTGPPARK